MTAQPGLAAAEARVVQFGTSIGEGAPSFLVVSALSEGLHR
jgi:hypothetical protein